MTLSWLTPPAYALIVGINEYDGIKGRNLNGCVADANAVYDFLTRDLGMEPTRIRRLLAPSPDPADRAIRATIIAGLQDFLAQATPDEEVLFYYSGHGSFTRLSDEIRYGAVYGETLVPADARSHDAAGNEIPDLLDCELRVLIAALADSGIIVTGVIDACHSGDVFRNVPKERDNTPLKVGARTPRMSPPANQIRGLASVLGGTVTQSHLNGLYARNVPYTLVSGCLANEQSYEINQADGVVRGQMTMAWLDTLHRANAPLTYDELERWLIAAIPKIDEDNLGNNQTPNISGIQKTRWLGSTQLPPRDALLIPVERVTEGRVVVRAGAIAGLQAGDNPSRFEWFDDLSLGEGKGRLYAVTVGPNRAELVAEADNPLPAPGCPLRLIAASTRPSVWFDDLADLVARCWIADAKTAPALREVTTRDADFTVTRRDNSWVVTYAKEEVIVSPFVESEDSVSKIRAAAGVARSLNRLPCYLRFATPASRTVYPLLDGADGDEDGLYFQAKGWENGRKSPLTLNSSTPLPGDITVTFTLTNRTAADLFVAVCLLDPQDHYVQVLWPADQGALVRAGQAINEKWSGADVSWRGGLLHFSVIASTDPELITLNRASWPCGRRILRGGGEAEPRTKGITGKQRFVIRPTWEVQTLTVGR